MQKAKPLDAAAEARAARARQEKEKESQRAWIMQYMEHEDSSDAASDQVSCSASILGAQSILRSEMVEECLDQSAPLLAV